MRILPITFVITTPFLMGGASVQSQKVMQSPIAALHAANPSVRWDQGTIVSADVTCDGKTDSAVVGYEGESVWVGVVPGSGAKSGQNPITMKFAVGKNSQDSFCAVPVRIETSPITCDDEEFGALPGCKPIKGCYDFSLVDDACDSFHFYWDSHNAKLVWWRR